MIRKLFIFIIFFLLVSIEVQGASQWTCDNPITSPFRAIGIDTKFSCLCIVKSVPTRHYGQMKDTLLYYKEWTVKANFAGFGCKGYCIKSSQWKDAVNETNDLIDKKNQGSVPEWRKNLIDSERLKVCESKMWNWF